MSFNKASKAFCSGGQRDAQMNSTKILKDYSLFTCQNKTKKNKSNKEVQEALRTSIGRIIVNSFSKMKRLEW